MRYEVADAEAVLQRLRTETTARARKAIRRGSRAGAKTVQARAKRDAPRASGTLQRALKVRSLRRSRWWVGSTCTLAADGKAYYGAFVDLGTARMRGRRFMRDAAEGAGRAAARAMIEAIEADLT